MTTLKIGTIVNLDYPLIHWFQADNSRSDSFGNPLIDLDAPYTRDEKGRIIVHVTPPKGVERADWNRGLVQQLIDGWDSSQGTTKAELITKDEVQRAIKERRQQIDAWKADKLFDLANTGESVWFPKGKAVEPVVKANETFRRGKALMGAIRCRAKEGLGFAYEVPVKVVEFTDPIERLIDHASENMRKDMGRSLYSPLDEFKLAVMLQKVGGIEADLVKAGISRGTAQRLFRTIRLSQLYAEVHGKKMPTLVERCFLPPTDKDANGKYAYKAGGYVHAPNLGKEELAYVIAGKDYRSEFSVDKAAESPVTVDNVESFLSDMMVGKKNATKILDKDAIKGLAGVPNKLVAFVAACIYAPANIDKLRHALKDDKFNDACNKLVDHHKIKTIAVS